MHKKKAGREDLEAFETAYNAACGCIARGELGQGEILLKRAKGRKMEISDLLYVEADSPYLDLCSSSIDLSEQEKNAELLPISVQQLYVFSASGKADLAEALASEIVLNEYKLQLRRRDMYSRFTAYRICQHVTLRRSIGLLRPQTLQILTSPTA